MRSRRPRPMPGPVRPSRNPTEPEPEPAPEPQPEPGGAGAAGAGAKAGAEPAKRSRSRRQSRSRSRAHRSLHAPRRRVSGPPISPDGLPCCPEGRSRGSGPVDAAGWTHRTDHHRRASAVGSAREEATTLAIMKDVGRGVLRPSWVKWAPRPRSSRGRSREGGDAVAAAHWRFNAQGCSGRPEGRSAD